MTYKQEASFPAARKWVPEKVHRTLHAAPCIGDACGGLEAGIHVWHPPNTEMLAFIGAGIARGDKKRMQRMCASCALMQRIVPQKTSLTLEQEARVAERKAEAERRRIAKAAKEAKKSAAKAPLRINPPLLPAPAPRPSPARALAAAAPAPSTALATSNIADGALVQVSSGRPSRSARKRPAPPPAALLAPPPTAAAVAAAVAAPLQAPGATALAAPAPLASKMIPGRPAGGLLGSANRTIVKRPAGIPTAPPPAAVVTVPDGIKPKAGITPVKQAIIAPVMKAFGAMLPTVQSDGGLKGKGDESTAQVITDLKQRQPNLPKMSLERAEARARSCRPVDGWEGKGGRAAKQKAMHAFHVEGLAIQGVCYIPEITGRGELSRDERFQVQRPHGEVGVKCICPSCKTNNYVRPTTVSCGDDAKSEPPPPTRLLPHSHISHPATPTFHT